MNEPLPVIQSATLGEPRHAIISEHVKGDSRIVNMSVRSVIALLITITLCAIVLVIVCRTRDVDAVLPALKDLWQPICLLVFAFYFTTKSPNKPTPPTAP